MKLTVAFRNFTNAPKKGLVLLYLQTTVQAWGFRSFGLSRGVLFITDVSNEPTTLVFKAHGARRMPAIHSFEKQGIPNPATQHDNSRRPEFFTSPLRYPEIPQWCQLIFLFRLGAIIAVRTPLVSRRTLNL
jgi:hypothetical protein